MREIPIRGETIRLGQLLKLAGVTGSGAEVKALLATSASPVRVNGAPETRRGRQLGPGDVVEAAGERLRVTRAADQTRPEDQTGHTGSPS